VVLHQGRILPGDLSRGLGCLYIRDKARNRGLNQRLGRSEDDLLAVVERGTLMVGSGGESFHLRLLRLDSEEHRQLQHSTDSGYMLTRYSSLMIVQGPGR
jgi:hypothetical protein